MNQAIDVTGGSYDSAAAAFVGGNQLAALFYNGLTRDLSGYGAMAGDDATSTEFSAQYDTAARDAVAAFNDLVDSFATLARLTAASIDNHRHANTASVFNRPPPVYTGATALGDGPVDVATSTPPSSLGGDNDDFPEFWNLVVDHLQGFAWPNADTDRLREAGSRWRSAAGDLRRLPSYCDTAISHLESQRSPEVPLAVNAAGDVKLAAGDLAEVCDSLADACEQYASTVDEHRDIIKGIMRDLAIEAGISVGVGVVVGFFTFGGGAAAGTAIAGTRAVRAAMKILDALNDLRRLAKARAVLKLESVVTKVPGLRTVLARFKRAKDLDEAAAVRKVDDLDDWRNLPPKIDHTWDEVVKYKKGDNTPLEHIKEGHWPDANTPGKSHFHEGITEEQLKDYVGEALRKGDIDPHDPGKITYDLGRTIGTDPQGNPVSTITVYVRNGVVNTAFPSP
ncbi:hypothetical protein [Nocardioides rubriscoriae]|uniref:WXG100-like domain-containing protein n=1 Tax=Nocardioides rubriscoriae TaxID=642762 RepID=UPI0011DFE8B6|nr:hypothetical protein [Nocardioides rubriscoriae]